MIDPNATLRAKFPWCLAFTDPQGRLTLAIGTAMPDPPRG